METEFPELFAAALAAAAPGATGEEAEAEAELLASDFLPLTASSKVGKVTVVSW